MMVQNMKAYVEDRLVRSIKGSLQIHALAKCSHQLLKIHIQDNTWKVLGIHGEATGN